jgi:hypothetical protein
MKNHQQQISVLFRAEGAEQWEEYSMCGDSAKGYRLMALLDVHTPHSSRHSI